MFLYAWGANAAIPWIVPVIGVTVRLLLICVSVVLSRSMGLTNTDSCSCGRRSSCTSPYSRTSRTATGRTRPLRSQGSRSSVRSFLRLPLIRGQQLIDAGNLMGTAFPLFTPPMYARLGIHWASTLFGCIAVAMVPIPYVRPAHLALHLCTVHPALAFVFGRVCAAHSHIFR